MNILVAGGGGFLGKFLISGLAKKGNNVTVIDIANCREAVERVGCDFIEGDLSQQVAINLDKNFDIAIFLSQSPFYRQLPERASHVMAVNVAGLTAFAEMARGCSVKHLLYASSGSIYKPSFLSISETSPIEPPNLYGLSKKMGEDLLEYFKGYFKITTLRYFGIYGPGQSGMLVPNLINRVWTGEPLTLEKSEFEDNESTGGFRTTPIYVTDVVEIMDEMILKGINGSFNISGPETLSISQMAKIIGIAVGKEPIISVSDRIRTGDLIADNTKMLSMYSSQLTDFATGINKTVNNII